MNIQALYLLLDRIVVLNVYLNENSEIINSL